VAIQPVVELFLCLCGDATIDISNAKLPPRKKVSYKVIMLCGDVEIIVPKGVAVQVRRISLCGDKTINIDENALNESSPRVTATIIVPCGDVKVTN
jgi:predicted membrane protein